MKLEKVVYQAHAKASGGRDGRAVSSDGAIDVKLTVPKEMGGAGAAGSNPEQLFAAGYAACFIGAMKHVAMMKKIKLPSDPVIDSTVGIGPIPKGFGIEVEMNITVPGMEKADAEALVAAAHEVCPYSNATRNNIDVKLNVV